jgi:methionine sulfoxide reductase heme-binding subunit
MPLRKEIGILMGTLALVHGISYIIPYPTYFFTTNFWTERSYALSFGFIALLLTLPLLFTSNIWSIKLLGKKWKILHRLVYIVIIFTVIHVVALKFSRHFEVGGVILLWIYFLGKILEWK